MTRGRKLGIAAAVAVLVVVVLAVLSGSGTASFTGSSSGRGSYSGTCPKDDPLCFMGAAASAARWDGWNKARLVADEARYNSDKAFDALRDKFDLEARKRAVQSLIDGLQVDTLRQTLDQQRRTLMEKARAH